MNSFRISKQSIYVFWVIVFIFMNLYLGKAKIFGDYSIRVPIAILAVLYTIQFKKFYRLNSYILLSIFYVSGYLISTILNNYNFLEFISDILISRFLFAFVFFYFILNTKNLHKTIVLFVIILFINTIFILGQYVDIDFFWNLTNKLLLVDEDTFTKSYRVFTKTRFVEGLSGTVYSGYISVVLIPLSIYLYQNQKKLIYLLFIFATLFSSFILQQRSAFILVVFTAFLSILNFNKSLFRNILFLLFGVVLFSISIDYYVSSSSQLIRLNDFSDVERIKTYLNSIHFITQNPIWGGFDDFYAFNGGKSPHNLFFNAWIRGGVIGFISIAALSFKVSVKSAKGIINNFNKKNLMFYSSIAMINLVILSLTHNESFTTGDFLHYGILALLLNSQINLK